MSLPDTPAFPKTGNFNNDPSGEYDSENQNGMSLRDYFAGQALIALIDKEQNPRQQINAGTLATVIAEEAYLYADAMVNESDDNAV
jgi:hypothetical protein